MVDIYEQHSAAFARVSAFVILNAERERVATVAIKFPADGAGRLYAYVHLIGVEMVRGSASGGGYDKRSAAVAEAIAKIRAYGSDKTDGHAHEMADSEYGRQINDALGLMQAAAPNMHSLDWVRALETAGLIILQAV